MIKNIISYLFCIIILVSLFFFIDIERFNIFKKVSIEVVLVSVFMAMVIFFISGIQYYFIRKQFGISLKTIDIFLLPSVIGLWSFIIPFQGSLLFSTYFFKKKYNMKISESLSINIYLYLVTLCFTGLFLLIFIINSKEYNLLLIFIALILLLNPFLLKLLRYFLNKITTNENKILSKIKTFIFSVLNSTNFLWSNLKFTLIILLIYIIKLIISIYWFYYIAHILSFNMSLFEVALISLVMSVSLIIKLTPGNLGTVQVISGGFMASIGSSADNAILITLFASATVLLINFTIGVLGNFYYFKTMNIFKIKQ